MSRRKEQSDERNSQGEQYLTLYRMQEFQGDGRDCRDNACNGIPFQMEQAFHAHCYPLHHNVFPRLRGCVGL